jgi:murein DD-endopeptidase MepM/ murein hydrolase activator NlpD
LDFTCPLPSVGRISTYFGEPDAVYNKPHTGADMPAASGTLIYAVADGVVSAASARPSYGNCVQIDHGTADDGSSYATLYAHMSSFCVSAGQTVHKGDVIGYVGNTGDVRGANGGYHLHLELRINGTRTDPLQYIPH